MLSLSVKGDEFTDVTFQVDTAATCNTLPYRMFQQLGNKSQLQRTSSKLVSYSGAIIKPLGKISLVHKSTSSYTLLDFQVVDLPNKPALLGLPDSLRLSLVSIDSTRVTSQSHTAEKSPQACHGIAPYVPLTKDTILSQFASTFTGLGNIGKPVSFSMDPNVTPIHAPPHRLPVAKRELVKAKLDEMVRDGKLQKVDGPTEWCSNITVRERVKPDGQIKVRLCLDPSQTVNKALVIPKFTVPTLPEILPQLSGKKCQCFTIMDALDGFTQVQITDDSKDITTMHTPWGRYRWLRLPYGISSAPEEFQMRMQELLDGLCGVGNIADDILIFGLGDTQEEADSNHDRHLLALLQCAEESRLKLNPNKIQFRLRELTFMGHHITENGILPDATKVEAILQFPQPESRVALQRFIGMANYSLYRL